MTVKPRDVRSGDANRRRGDGDDRATGWRLGSPGDGSILVQREVSAPLVIVGEVALQVAAQRALVLHDDVIEALAPDGTDHAFNERILPGGRGAVSTSSMPICCTVRREIRSVNRVTIPDDESRCGVPWPRLAELLRGPRRGRMRRDVQVDDAASIVRQHHEHKQHAKGGGRDREEVDRGELGDVIGEEGAPRLGRGTPRRPRYFATVACDTSMPSFCSSPWMRGAPQNGLASRIWRINARRSAASAGRPTRRGREFQRQ